MTRSTFEFSQILLAGHIQSDWHFLLIEIRLIYSVHHDKNKIYYEKQLKTAKNKFLKIYKSIFYFILNSPPLTRVITCSKLYSDGKNMSNLWIYLNVDIIAFKVVVNCF